MNQNNNLYEMIIQNIKNMIVSGELKSGDILPSERELAARFNVSRVPVREAIKILEFIGLLTTRGNSKTIQMIDIPELYKRLPLLIDYNYEEIIDLFETRIILEPQAAFLAALNRTNKDIISIKQSLNQLIHHDDTARIYEDSMLIHTRIIEATHNSFLIALYQSLYEFLILSKKITMKPGNIQRSIDDHTRIMDAIINQDATLAEKEMRSHLIDAKIRFINLR